MKEACEIAVGGVYLVTLIMFFISAIKAVYWMMKDDLDKASDAAKAMLVFNIVYWVCNLIYGLFF